MIYFDNSATTRPYPEVLEAMERAATDFFANPSSLHSQGERARKLLEQSRQVAARIFSCKPGEIVFTSGATESNNLAVKGVALQYQNRGKHVITTSVEHASVYESCRQLEQLGFEVTYLPVNREGRISVDDLRQAIRKDTILVSVMYVNNELGTIQPIAEIGELLATYPKILFHVDGVQGFGKLPLDVKKWKIDLLSLSGHKFHGPRGSGLLYVREGVSLFPLLVGGGQENGLRSGTENLPGIVGFVKALKMNHERQPEQYEQLKILNRTFLRRLSAMKDVQINSPLEGETAPHIVNFSVPGLKAEVIIHSLEQKDIYVSTRSACSSRADRPSRTLLACGLDEMTAKSALRVSFHPDQNEREIEQFFDVFPQVIQHIKQVMRV